jgi:glycosyltransferase involved in cell wall biosynthesis
LKIVTVMNNVARGGADFAVLSMLDALAERGHEAILLSDRPEVARGVRVATRRIDIGPKLSRRTWVRLLVRWPRHSRRLRRVLEGEAPYDVLLVHYKKDQLMASTLPARLRPVLVWAEWGPVPGPMRRGLPRRLYVRAARRANLILAVSEHTKQSVCELGVELSKVEVVPNVMRPDEVAFSAEGRARIRRELGIPEQAFVVGCLSRLHPKKRLEVAVDAVRRLDSSAHLVLAGVGEAEDRLRARATPLGARAHFVPTPGDDVGDYLSAFDVLVFCPSETEGAPRAVLLAMLAERPWIATGSEGVADLLRLGAGEVTDPEQDAAALGEALRRYLADPALREAAGAAGGRLVRKRYAPSSVAERIEHLLRAAADSTR